MGTDIILQVALILLGAGAFFAIHALSKQSLTKLRSKSRSTAQSHRHFVQGAQLLGRARSTRNPTTSYNLAKNATIEADKALSINPQDATSLILKALALHLMGRKASALKYLDAALSLPAVKNLSGRERGDALFKRAEIHLSVNKKRRVNAAVADLVEAVKLTEDNGKAYCLLGECFEIKGMREEAKKAFQDALRVEPGLVAAREGFTRMDV